MSRSAHRHALVRGAAALALLAALLPAGALADASLGDCTAHAGGKGKTLDLCLGPLKGLRANDASDPASVGAAAGLPADQSGDPDPSGGGWSISGTLVPDLADQSAQPSPDASEAERLLQSLRLKQFMVRLSRPF